MKRLAVLFAGLLQASAAFAGPIAIDGDTVIIQGEKIRILNIDTPEIHGAKCDAELRLGQVAKRRLQALLEAQPLNIIRGDNGRMKDRYGRTLARIEVRGEDVGDVLIEEGLAREWAGKRQPWCG